MKESIRLVTPLTLNAKVLNVFDGEGRLVAGV